MKQAKSLCLNDFLWEKKNNTNEEIEIVGHFYANPIELLCSMYQIYLYTIIYDDHCHRDTHTQLETHKTNTQTIRSTAWRTFSLSEILLCIQI